MKTPSLAGMVSFSLSVIGLTVLAAASPAKAGILAFDQSNLNLFKDSTPVDFDVTLNDEAEAGKVKFEINVADGFFADLRGLFFHIRDESLLSGLSITSTSPYITQVVTNANSVLDLGGGGNLKGNKNSSNSFGAGGFDVGVEIGTQGEKDDIRSATFMVSHATQKLSLADFAEQGFGVRMMSVGTSANQRGGSSKFTGIAPSLPPIKIEQSEVPPVDSQSPVTQPAVNDPAPEQPQSEVPPVIGQPPLDEPTPEQPKPDVPSVTLPPVVVVAEPPKPEEEPVEVPEPSTVFLALASIGAFKLLKKNKTVQGEACS